MKKLLGCSKITSNCDFNFYDYYQSCHFYQRKRSPGRTAKSKIIKTIPDFPTMTTEALTLEEQRPIQRSRLRVFTLVSVLYAALFISAVNTTIVTTALPTIAKHFESTSGYTWVGAAYVLADTASGPVWTNLSDIWGRKVIFLIAVALFIVSSCVCGFSTSMGMLISGRALQGAAAGAIMLLVNIVISDMFDMRRRTLYLGICDVIWAISGAVGPVIGGAFAQYAGWRWIW